MVEKLVSDVIAMEETHVRLDIITDRTVETGTTNVRVKSLVVKNLAFLCALLQTQMVQNYLLSFSSRM